MIAVDALGGDFAPHAILEGALRASRTRIPVALFGPLERIVPILDQLDTHWRGLPITLFQASEEILMDEEPAMAVRRKKDSSLVRAVSAVADGTCTGVISAGNSGALMIASMFILGKTEGIERPAIAGFIPTKDAGSTLVLDLGGNVNCKASHLLHFAHLGIEHLLTRSVVRRPLKIGLLCNGSEENKGSALIKEVHQLFSQQLNNFIGNVEPADVLANKADIVVCDGFTGNIFLKTIEACSKFFAQEGAAHIIPGGAQLLGVKGTVIVAHGNSLASSIQKAIQLAHHVKQNVVSLDIEHASHDSDGLKII